MLRVRVDEVPSARPHQHKHGHEELTPTIANELHVRCRAAMGEIGAQLDAVRATLGGRERGVERLDGRLDENGQRAFEYFTS